MQHSSPAAPHTSLQIHPKCNNPTTLAKTAQHNAATHLLAGALESQCGGLGGKGADICLHYGRAHWQYLQASERSGFQAYTDLSAAFASVRRAIAFMPDRSDRAIMSAVGRFIFEPDAYAHLVRILTEPDALQAIGVGPRLRALLQCAHECTWFTMQGLEQPSSTEDGAKAGAGTLA